MGKNCAKEKLSLVVYILYIYVLGEVARVVKQTKCNPRAEYNYCGAYTHTHKQKRELQAETIAWFSPLLTFFCGLREQFFKRSSSI